MEQRSGRSTPYATIVATNSTKPHKVALGESRLGPLKEASTDASKDRLTEEAGCQRVRHSHSTPGVLYC